MVDRCKNIEYFETIIHKIKLRIKLSIITNWIKESI